MNNEEKILQLLAEMKATQDSMLRTQDGILSRLDKLEATQKEMQAAQDEMQTTLTRVAVTQEGMVLPRIQLALEGHSELKRELDTLATKEQVQDLSSDVDVIKAVVTRHGEDIGKLKKAQ